MLKRILLRTAAALAVVVVAAAGLVELRWKRTFGAPLPDLRAARRPRDRSLAAAQAVR